MSRKLGFGLSAALLCAATTVVTFVAPTAHAATTSLPSGAALSIEITNPLDGAVFTSGSTVAISGSASVEQAPAVKNTDLVFVVDTSGSTGTTTGIGCGSILQCEKAAVLELIGQANAARSPIGNVGAAAFPDTDVLGLVAPNSAAIQPYLDGLLAGGGTDFSDGISRTRPLLGASTAAQKLVVFLTDGEGTLNSGEAPLGAVVLAFAIGGQGCTTSLQGVVALGTTGSACAVVDDLGDLANVIKQTIGSSLDTITVKVDTTTVYSAAPAVAGPGSAAFSVNVPGLTAGSHQVCATATGSDASGSGSITECAPITVLPPGSAVVDCAGTTDCAANAQDPGKSTLAFAAPPAFNETVTIVPNSGASGACGGATCRTGYDVLFPTTSATGPVVSLTVVTANKISLLDRLQAAVFIDNKRITAQCNNRVIIKLVRDLLGKPEPIPCITIKYLPTGQAEYFVKFRSDPGVRFR